MIDKWEKLWRSYRVPTGVMNKGQVSKNKRWPRGIERLFITKLKYPDIENRRIMYKVDR